jgi:hypothetical protein
MYHLSLILSSAAKRKPTLRACDFLEFSNDFVVVTVLFAAWIFGKFEKVTNSEQRSKGTHMTVTAAGLDQRPRPLCVEM